MVELTFDFDPRGVQEAEDGEEGGRLSGKVRKAWGTAVSVILTPCTDCRRRSHPRVVPDYSLLVLMACVANPALGVLVCFLHVRAKNLSHKGQERKADVLYIVMIGLAVLSIAGTLMSLSLLVGYGLIQRFARHNLHLRLPPKPCVLREIDDKRRKEMNMTRYEYCVWLLAQGGNVGKSFTNSTRVIDLHSPCD